MDISKKNIISIWKFMENYYGVMYMGNYKLTHNEMSLYLRSKSNLPVKRSNFQSIDNESILCGEIILVRDEEGKVIPYVNPRRLKNNLIEELDSMNEIRNSIMESFYKDEDDFKKIGEDDYRAYSMRKGKILPRKKRVLRRSYE